MAGGVGLAGIAVGTVFGLQSKSKHDQEPSHGCTGSSCSDPTGASLSRDAVKAGNLSTVGFIVGAAGLAGGALLWFSAKDKSAQVGLAPGAVLVRGAW